MFYESAVALLIGTLVNLITILNDVGVLLSFIGPVG